jgi:hypothetical protein
LYPNKSGTPKDAQDSNLVHCILGVFRLTNFQKFVSDFTVTRNATEQDNSIEYGTRLAQKSSIFYNSY